MTLTSCEEMERLCFYLLLHYLILSDSTSNTECCLSQPTDTMWKKAGNTVVLLCNVDPDCSGQNWKYKWFLFKENYHMQLRLSEYPDKYKLDGASLHIKTLHGNDSGIYHCAAVSLELGPRKQFVSAGQTLNVKEKMIISIYLWVVFTLLSVYSLALVTLIVKKYSCKKMKQITKHNSTKKLQFRDVLQEMRGKKFREQCKQNSSNGPQTETEDVYQNVKERFEMAN